MIGMLWFDNDPKATLPAKIQRAAEFYERKYGKIANVCYVRSGAADIRQVGNVEVRESRTLQLHHLWLGVETEE